MVIRSVITNSTKSGTMLDKRSCSISYGMEKEKGFIVRWFLFAIVVLGAAYYFFNWSIFDAIESEQGRNTINYIRDVLNVSWEYIKIPFVFIWDKISGSLSR